MKKLFFSIILLLSFSIAFAQNIEKWKMNDLKSYIEQGKGVLVINFWATFCKPCITEISDFIKISEQYEGQQVKLLLVSLDQPANYPKKLASFVKKQKFFTSIVWLDESDANYFCPLVDTSWSGSIPSTLMINSVNGYRRFFEMSLDPVIFEKELKLAIEAKL